MEVIELAKSLISFRSEAPPGNEEGCARFLRDYLVDLHIDGLEATVDVFAPGRANLIACLGPAEAGLMLSGHLDVVPAGDLSSWSGDPYVAHVRGDRLYGRGAADMKSGLAAITKAFESAKRTRLKRGLVLVATAGEEVGFDGLLSMLGRGALEMKPRFGVVAEPSDLCPIRAHKGGATFKVTFHGKSGHASKPDLGVNAVEECAKYVIELARWSEEMARNRAGHGREAELGHTLATSTVVRGGTKSNVIPDACELTVDARWLPSHGTRFVQRALKRIARAVHSERKGACSGPAVELLYDYPSLYLDRKHELVALGEKESGNKAQIAPYGTEASVYAAHGVPTIVLGPGSVSDAHVPDEHVNVADVRRAESIFRHLVKDICA